MSQYKRHTPVRTRGAALFSSPLDFLPGKYKVKIVKKLDDKLLVLHEGYTKGVKYIDKDIPDSGELNIEVGMSKGVAAKMRGSKVQLVDYHTGFIHGEMDMADVTVFLISNQLSPTVPVILSWNKEISENV